MKSKAPKIIKLIIVNFFTIGRLIGAFMLPFIYLKYGSDTCAVWTICLFLTDAVDGFLARHLHISTFFGSSMDALSDKVLNAISFILLGITYSIMIPPLILEISILLIIYNTYRNGGNIQSSKTGKIKTIILDICIIGSFILISLPKLNINTFAMNYIINNTHYYIVLLGCICTVSEIIALIDYNKKNVSVIKNPNNTKIKYLDRVRKTFKEVINDAFDTEYYLIHKEEPIMKQFYKIKNKL
jgi:phosphatidylglycerophosphate synthase